MANYYIQEKVRVSSSVNKITEGTSIVLPVTHACEIPNDISSYSWNIYSKNARSTFKENRRYRSFFSIKNLSGSNSKDIFVKVSNVSDGEVIFFACELIATTGGGDKYYSSGTVCVYRGTPQDVPIDTIIVRNGRAMEISTYGMPIERRIINASENFEFFPVESSAQKIGSEITIDRFLSRSKNNNDKAKQTIYNVAFPSTIDQIKPNYSKPSSYLGSKAKENQPNKNTALHVSQYFLEKNKPAGFSSVTSSVENPDSALVPIFMGDGIGTRLMNMIHSTALEPEPPIMPVIPYPNNPCPTPTLHTPTPTP